MGSESRRRCRGPFEEGRRQGMLPSDVGSGVGGHTSPTAAGRHCPRLPQLGVTARLLTMVM